MAATTFTSLPAKSVVEYALPAAAQTHEVLAVSDNLLLVSQQSDGSLVKVSLGEHGQITGAHKYTPTNPWSGLHGLAKATTSIPGLIWATLQFDNKVLLINPNTNDINQPPQVLSGKTISVPSPARGPHGIIEHNGNLWLTCKDSSHIVRISIANPSDHQVWPVRGRPIFVAVHPTSGDLYASLDSSSRIWHYSGNNGNNGQELPIPTEEGSTPVGMIAGADGNIWFVLAGSKTTGTGTFGRILPTAIMEFFTLSSPLGSKAGLLHLAWGKDATQLYLLGSSIINPDGINAVFTVKIENTVGGTAHARIVVQNAVVLPTQRSATHRIILHRGSLYVTELLTSTLAHVSGAVMEGLQVSETWDDFGLWRLGAKADVVVYNQTA